MENASEFINNWLTPFISNKYLQAIIIALLSFALAKLGDLFFSKIALRLAYRTKTDLDDQLITISHRPIFSSFLCLGLYVSLQVLELPVKFESLTVSLMRTLLVIVWMAFSIKFTALVLSFLSRNPGKTNFVQDRTLPLFTNLAKMVIIGGAIYFFLLSWKIDVTAWVASAGIIGIAVGFAAKDTLSNLFSGMFILADAPFQLGDFIILDSGERGQITHIGIRSTRLLTRDDVEITIPNAIMGNSKIINESGGPHKKERIRVKIGAAYGSDLQKVLDVLMDIAKSNKDVCSHPEPRVRFRNFGDSSLDFELLCWVEEPVLRGRILHDLNCTIYNRFIEEKISIPFPQRDVHIQKS
ncbi:MAG: mechanosensitive ion channel [Fibrobacteria bacterium]|nr:mechanosensitive ion channel [Fibrobacteria bacterium]